MFAFTVMVCVLTWVVGAIVGFTRQRQLTVVPGSGPPGGSSAGRNEPDITEETSQTPRLPDRPTTGLIVSESNGDLRRSDRARPVDWRRGLEHHQQPDRCDPFYGFIGWLLSLWLGHRALLWLGACW